LEDFVNFFALRVRIQITTFNSVQYKKQAREVCNTLSYSKFVFFLLIALSSDSEWNCV